MKTWVTEKVQATIPTARQRKAYLKKADQKEALQKAAPQIRQGRLGVRMASKPFTLEARSGVARLTRKGPGTCNCRNRKADP